MVRCTEIVMMIIAIISFQSKYLGLNRVALASGSFLGTIENLKYEMNAYFNFGDVCVCELCACVRISNFFLLILDTILCEFHLYLERIFKQICLIY